MDSTLRRHSRRSHPNLQQLSIKPLTPNFPLESTAVDDAPSRNSVDDDGVHLSATPISYIAPRSLPQTPSILSRSNSRSRRPSGNGHKASGSRSSVVLPDLSGAGIQPPLLTPRRLKGAGIGGHGRHHVRSQSSGVRLQSPDGASWILQTASALTASAAESKGQAWLATRTSSTSLADVGAGIERKDGSYAADDEFSPVSHRYASRPQSRFGSRHASRRGSRVGLMTPAGIKTPGDRDDAGSDYFGSVRADFVDGLEDEEDADAEDGEVRQVIWGRVGGWVDWAVGWMDFRADEDDAAQLAAMEEDTAAAAPQDEKPKRKIKWKQRRGRQEGRSSVGGADAHPVAPAPENEGLAQDAAWLWGLAKSNLV